MADNTNEPSNKVVVEARVRGLLPEGYRLAGDAVDELDAEVKRIVEAAVQRCQGNGRKTLQKQDF